MAKTILIVDDEEIITRSLQKLLTHRGYEVVLAHDADEALQRVKDSAIDLVVSDIRMPGGDGVSLIKQIREYLRAVNRSLIPEVLITGFADLDKYEKAKELNVAGYLNKPFDMRNS